MIADLIPVAQNAGHAIMDVYRAGITAEVKQDGSPVTEADQKAEAIILSALKEKYPSIPVISEENAESHSIDAPHCFFLVDPLDGTKEFLKQDGKGAFTVNIALVENGSPTMGIVYAPALERMFSGSQQTGARDNGDSVTVRDVPGTGAVAVASASHRDMATDQWLSNHSVKQTVSIGSSLKFCLIASGEADVYPRFGPTMEWDTAAGDAILRSAGGKVIHPDGALFDYGKRGYRNGAFIAKGKM